MAGRASCSHSSVRSYLGSRANGIPWQGCCIAEFAKPHWEIDMSLTSIVLAVMALFVIYMGIKVLLSRNV